MDTSKEELSLEEIIKLKKSKVRCAREALDLSLDEYIQASNEYKSVMGSAPGRSLRDPGTMSLGEVIRERNLRLPQHVSRVTEEPEVEPNLREWQPRSTKPVGKLSLRPLDPMTSCLDELIQGAVTAEVVPLPQKSSRASFKRTVNAFDEDEMEKDRKQQDVAPELDHLEEELKPATGLQQKRQSLTPWRAMGFLSEAGMVIESKMGRLSDPSSNKDHMWRCHIICGKIEGIADSVRKVVAREMASDQVLKQLKEMPGNIKVPRYEIPDELFIDPKIFHRLGKLAEEKGLAISNHVTVNPVRTEDPDSGKFRIAYVYLCTYHVDGNRFKGENLDQKFATLLAAKKALEFVIGEEVLNTIYFVGSECDPKVEYDYNESEVCRVVVSAIKQEEEKMAEIPKESAEVALRKVAEIFIKAKQEEEEQRRNMPLPEDFKAFTCRGRGRGRATDERPTPEPRKWMTMDECLKKFSGN